MYRHFNPCLTYLIWISMINDFGNNVIFAVPSFGFPTRFSYSSFTRMISVNTYFSALFKGLDSFRTGSKHNYPFRNLLQHPRKISSVFKPFRCKNKGVFRYSYSREEKIQTLLSKWKLFIRPRKRGETYWINPLQSC